ncbi:MAG: carbamoyltransferase HypF, partial [Clostridium sp.]
NSPKTSSIGRLFDGVASILGFHNDVDYEGEGAIYLEELGKRGNSKETYDYDICEEGRFVIDTSRVIQGIVSDFLNMVRLEDIALKFHNTIIRFSCDICIRIRRDTSLNTVALSGGVFQNSILLNGIKDKLLENGFKTLTHRIIPCNDSGLSVGQLYIANELMR